MQEHAGSDGDTSEPKRQAAAAIEKNLSPDHPLTTFLSPKPQRTRTLWRGVLLMQRTFWVWRIIYFVVQDNCSRC
jgi:hypothetical protein